MQLAAAEARCDEHLVKRWMFRAGLADRVKSRAFALDASFGIICGEAQIIVLIHVVSCRCILSWCWYVVIVCHCVVNDNLQELLFNVIVTRCCMSFVGRVLGAFRVEPG